MKTKEVLIAIILSILVLGLFIFDKKTEKSYIKANTGYLVYLNNKKIGLIKDDQKLYQLINKKQNEIKAKYQVKKVYPPTSFKIIKANTYNNDFVTENDIYNKMAEVGNFAIKGYTITIKFNEEENLEPVKINVIDKKVFENALYKFVTAFITEEELKNYISGDQKELTDIGQMIKTMYFNETITIKENNISLKDKIFIDEEELSQYLLFGENAKMNSYVVTLGDNIQNISEAHKLNPQEFLIANPKYRASNTILTIGSEVNVTLVNPVLTFIYEVYKIEQAKIRYETQKIVDDTKEYGYEEITTPGVTGITLNHENYQVINGVASDEVKMTYEIIRDKVDQVITTGRRSWISGRYIPTSGEWGWPTNQPSIITSPYGYRCLRGKCKVHEGIDISGTGHGSPIYAIGDGVVTQAHPVCTNCSTPKNGNFVIIDHENGYYSAYLHLASFNVEVGQRVKKGEQIAKMGDTGYTTGTHLHLGVYVEGEPFTGVHTRSINPIGSIY